MPAADNCLAHHCHHPQPMTHEYSVSSSYAKPSYGGTNCLEHLSFPPKQLCDDGLRRNYINRRGLYTTHKIAALSGQSVLALTTKHRNRPVRSLTFQTQIFIKIHIHFGVIRSVGLTLNHVHEGTVLSKPCSGLDISSKQQSGRSVNRRSLQSLTRVESDQETQPCEDILF
jgi:hypothetical protein